MGVVVGGGGGAGGERACWHQAVGRWAIGHEGNPCVEWRRKATYGGGGGGEHDIRNRHIMCEMKLFF